MRWVLFGENREAPELGAVGFTTTFDEDGAVLRENGNCGLSKSTLQLWSQSFPTLTILC